MTGTHTLDCFQYEPMFQRHAHNIVLPQGHEVHIICYMCILKLAGISKYQWAYTRLLCTPTLHCITGTLTLTVSNMYLCFKGIYAHISPQRYEVHVFASWYKQIQ